MRTARALCGRTAYDSDSGRIMRGVYDHFYAGQAVQEGEMFVTCHQTFQRIHHDRIHFIDQLFAAHLDAVVHDE